jgi:hypothetical protein
MHSGGGMRTQERTITTPLKPGCPCKACPPLINTESCNTEACPAECNVTEWSSWSSCSNCNLTTGVGLRRRTRLNPADGNGSAVMYVCYLSTTQALVDCHQIPIVIRCPSFAEQYQCPCGVDCLLGEWSQYSACSVSCGPGIKTRSRPVLQHPLANGTQYSHSSVSSKRLLIRLVYFFSSYRRCNSTTQASPCMDHPSCDTFATTESPETLDNISDFYDGFDTTTTPFTDVTSIQNDDGNDFIGLW